MALQVVGAAGGRRAGGTLYGGKGRNRSRGGMGVEERQAAGKGGRRGGQQQAGRQVSSPKGTCMVGSRCGNPGWRQYGARQLQ